TVHYGTISDTEEIKGESESKYTQKYDAQKDVFNGILADLKEANELLAANPDIIAGDIIYQGNSGQWQKLINAFRLKVLMTLSHQESDTELNIKSEIAS